MKFTKWQGTGNDFVFLDGRPETISRENLPVFVRWICNRNFGIGADGLVFVFKDSEDMLNMRIFNSDGSEAEMCGNALRCIAKYAYQYRIVEERIFKVKTKAGIKIPEIILDGNDVIAVRVDIGEPILERELIPVAGPAGKRVINEDVEVDGEKIKITAVSMGNPHCLIFVSNAASAPVCELGPRLECHKIFPKRTNVEFIEVVNQKEITVRVWERGVGETLACGTGACASVVGGVLNGKLDRKVWVNLPGGKLFVEWETNNHVYLTGPAEEVFRGDINDVLIKQVLEGEFDESGKPYCKPATLPFCQDRAKDSGS